MASVYQRFSGKINTNTSFPAPPEASHLLGGRVKEEENAAKTPAPCQDPRSRVVHHKRSQCNDEDVSETISLHSQSAIVIRFQSPWHCYFFLSIASHCWCVTVELRQIFFCNRSTCEFSKHRSSLTWNPCEIAYCNHSLLVFDSNP